MEKNKKLKVIFFGNGMLAEYALAVLEKHFEIVFHARRKEDLEIAKKMKLAHPEIHAVLASFGVLIPGSVLEVFEPEGILNIHPSLLPAYRGASPIESAIMDGAVDFSVSVMKLMRAMDAGPLYYQTTLSGAEIAKKSDTCLVFPGIPEKKAIYQALAETGAKWIGKNLANLPEPTPQDDSLATFCGKFDKSMSYLKPETEGAEEILRKIIAFSGFPKTKFTFYGVSCIVLGAHILKEGEEAVLTLPCADGRILSIDRLQPESRKPMDAKAFLNGYRKASLNKVSRPC